MRGRYRPALFWTFALLVLVWTGSTRSEEAPGIAVGTQAPVIKGKWVTEDGTTPDLKGKVVLVDFWFVH